MSREANERAISYGNGRLDRISAVMAGAGLVGTSAWLYYEQLARTSGAPGGDKPALAAVVVLATWAGQASAAQARRGAVRYGVNISPAAMIVAFAYLSPWLAIVSSGVGCLVALAGNARYSVRSWRWLRTSVPLGAHLLTITSGLVLYRHWLGEAAPEHRPGWQAGALSVVVTVAAGRALWWSLPWLRAEDASERPARARASQAVAEALGSALLGLVAVSVLAVNSWDALLVVLTAGVVAYGYRSALDNGRRQDEVGALYDFTTGLAGLTDAQEVAQSVLEQARRLMHADRSELVFRGLGEDRVLARCRYDGAGFARWENAGHVSAFDAQALAGQAPSAMSGCPGELAASPARRLAPIDTLVAPFDPEEPAQGYLLVTGRQRRGFGFEMTEQRFFHALASSAGSAMRSGQLLSHLRSQLAIREHQARHDVLTGLGNRRMFAERLSAALSRMPAAQAAALFLDLDDFKDVNDAIGHAAGDEVLRQVAARLVPFGGGASLVARLGGDEFAVLLGVVSGPAHARAIAAEIIAALGRPIVVEGATFDVRASVGIAIAPATGRARDAVNLMRQADLAMYAAKTTGDGICVYDPAQDRSTMRRLTLATELRRALEHGGLDLWYQPVVELGSGEVTGCEALLRWAHPELGAISPVELIPVAESSGLIDPLTWWALDAALDQLRGWRERLPGLNVAVNLSARTLPSKQLLGRVQQALDLSGLPAGALTLELTESSMLRDPETCQRALVELSEMGVGLSLDDYGTGFSSLSRLKQLPFRDLKIDRSFVKEMVHDKGDEAIVRSTIELARNLGRLVIAEGVEDKATLHRLTALGCHAAQGYYLAQPLPPPECEVWLTAFVRWPTTFRGEMAVAGAGALAGTGALAGAGIAPAEQGSRAGNTRGGGGAAWPGPPAAWPRSSTAVHDPSVTQDSQ